MEQKFKSIENEMQAIIDAFVHLAEELFKCVKRFCNNIIIFAMKIMPETKTNHMTYRVVVKRKVALRRLVNTFKE